MHAQVHMHQLLLTPFEEQVLQNWCEILKTTKDAYLRELVIKGLGIRYDTQITTSTGTQMLNVGKLVSISTPRDALDSERPKKKKRKKVLTFDTDVSKK